MAAALQTWTQQLHHTGLIADCHLTGYRHHAGRWGPDAAATERVFTTDTVAAITELTRADTVPIDALTAASAVDLAESLAPTPEAGWQWLTKVLPHEAVHIDRRIRAAAFDLADRPGSHRPTAQAWQGRRDALTAYRPSLGPAREPAACCAPSSTT
ncbi:hypothetical protein GCM10029992_38010 [Glycomyces albus]